MSRLVFLVVLAAVVYLLVRSFQNRQKGQNPPAAPTQAPRGEDMVRCAHCGVHMPVSESLLANGNYYCSEAHRRAHQDTSGKNGG